MRLFILFILIVFCNKSLAQDNKKLNQYFSNQNYSLYVSYFENIFKSKDYDNIDPNLVANYIVSLLKSNFNSSDAMLPSRKLKIISDNYGIKSGHIETVHSYTNDQNLIDNFHKGDRRGRGAPLNLSLIHISEPTRPY